jgi:hypothetical protein
LTRTKTALVDSALWVPRLRPQWDVRLLKFNPNQMLQYGVPVAEMIAEKRAGPPPTDPAAASARRFPALQQLLEELDEIRLVDDEARVLDFLRRWLVEPEWTPREIYAVSRELGATASPEFRRAHGTEIDRINQSLAAVLDAS